MLIKYSSPHRIPLFQAIFWVLVAAVAFCQTKAAIASDQLFPLYKSIRKNVAFWEKVYCQYSLSEAVIHDSEDLSKIYEIIPLLDSDLPGAARFNGLFQRQTIEKYSTILIRLTSEEPATRDEKRIAALFTGRNRYRDMARAATNIRSQRGQKERFLAGVIQSGRYMEEIKQIFRSYHLPEELAYLPHVESSFNFRAYSKHGAAGIWQFTRETGKYYLTINHSLDERLDPTRASHAAAKYLQNSYRTLNDWPLALTSYNYGLAGMVRAVNEQGDYESIFLNYNKGYFKFASKNFYPEFLAALRVAKRLEADTRITIDAAQPNRYVILARDMRIRDAGQRFGLATETLVSLNPALLPPVVKGQRRIPKSYAIRLPADKNRNLQLASIPATSYKKKEAPNFYYRVRHGDTAGSIARRHGVSVASLITANKLDKSGKLYVDQKLLIPKSVNRVGDIEKKFSAPTASATIKRVPSGRNPVKPTLVAIQKRILPTDDKISFPKKDSSVYKVANIHQKRGKIYGYITVQPEESLGLYGEWLGLPDGKLSTLNGLRSGRKIAPGQRLLLVFNKLSPARFAAKRLAFLQETEKDFFSDFTIVDQKIYTVNSGDTLWDLCYNKFDIPLWLLRRYNATVKLTGLNTEQKLVVPILQEI